MPTELSWQGHSRECLQHWADKDTGENAYSTELTRTQQNAYSTELTRHSRMPTALTRHVPVHRGQGYTSQRHTRTLEMKGVRVCHGQQLDMAAMGLRCPSFQMTTRGRWSDGCLLSGLKQPFRQGQIKTTLGGREGRGDGGGRGGGERRPQPLDFRQADYMWDWGIDVMTHVEHATGVSSQSATWFLDHKINFSQIVIKSVLFCFVFKVYARARARARVCVCVCVCVSVCVPSVKVTYSSADLNVGARLSVL